MIKSKFLEWDGMSRSVEAKILCCVCGGEITHKPVNGRIYKLGINHDFLVLTEVKKGLKKGEYSDVHFIHSKCDYMAERGLLGEKFRDMPWQSGPEFLLKLLINVFGYEDWKIDNHGDILTFKKYKGELNENEYMNQNIGDKE